jgi:ATP synthase protein I
MSNPVDKETLRRLDERADALQARTARPSSQDYGGQAVGNGYKLLGTLTGGILVGLGAGFVIDAFAGTKPWATIAGVLLGFGVSVFLTVRSAQRMSADWTKDHGPGDPVPFVDDDEDEGA